MDEVPSGLQLIFKCAGVKFGARGVLSNRELNEVESIPECLVKVEGAAKNEIGQDVKRVRAPNQDTKSHHTVGTTSLASAKMTPSCLDVKYLLVSYQISTMAEQF